MSVMLGEKERKEEPWNEKLMMSMAKDRTSAKQPLFCMQSKDHLESGTER